MTEFPLAVITKLAHFDRVGGGQLVLPVNRLACLVLVGPEVVFDAWVDSGSPLTVFPEKDWRPFEAAVTWRDDLAGGLPKLNVAGGEFPFRFGRVMLDLMSADLRAELVGLEVEAMFPFDDGRLPITLLSLWGGALAGRRLVVEPDLASARLEAA